MKQRDSAFISVDELMGKIHEQIGGSSTASFIANSGGRLSADTTTLAAGIENDILAADSFSQVRTSLGSTRFLGRIPLFQSLLLRLLAFIFRDQRNVNNSVIGAFRKSLQLNVRLAEEIDLLKVRIGVLEAQPGERPATPIP